MKAFAVVGMCGSGKSFVTHLLEEEGCKLFYFGGVVLDKVKEANLDISPENEKKIRERLRKEYGMNAMAKILYPSIKKALVKSNVVLDGLYSWSEYVYLKEKLQDDLIVISLITNRCIRYERLNKRKIRPLTNHEAEMRDIYEIENIEKGGPIAIADFYIWNNGSIDELERDLYRIMSPFL